MDTMIGPKKAASGVEVRPAMTRPPPSGAARLPTTSRVPTLSATTAAEGGDDGGHDGERKGVHPGRQGRVALHELEVLGHQEDEAEQAEERHGDRRGPRPRSGGR